MIAKILRVSGAEELFSLATGNGFSLPTKFWADKLPNSNKIRMDRRKYFISEN